jgi:predicted nucleic acid-binding protein
MRAVLDSSAGLQTVLPEADTAKAIRLIDEYARGLHELLAPDIFPVETLNGLMKAERQKRIPAGTGFALWQTIMADAPLFHPHFQLMGRAYAIGTVTRVAIYDCLYVALAEREGCLLITSDQKLITNLQKPFPFIVPLSSLP